MSRCDYYQNFRENRFFFSDFPSYYLLSLEDIHVTSYIDCNKSERVSSTWVDWTCDELSLGMKCEAVMEK